MLDLSDAEFIEGLTNWSDSEFATLASGEYCEDLKANIEGVIGRQADIIATLRAAQQWRGIDSAPDDTLCLLFEPHDMGGFCFVGIRNFEGLWCNNLDSIIQQPTHWMPLPPDPKPLPPAPDGGE